MKGIIQLDECNFQVEYNLLWWVKNFQSHLLKLTGEIKYVIIKI